jgi:protein SCO1/2
MNCFAKLLSLAGALLLFPAAAEPPPALRYATVTQRFNSQIPLDTEFIGEAGEPVSLRSLFRGRPVLLIPVYYSCPRLCSMILTGALKTMRMMPLTVGRDFDVVTLSFDPREQPSLASEKRTAYLKGYGRPGAGDGWRFLTGTPQEIRRVLDAAGFGFSFDAETGQFAHSSALIVLTPRGRVSRYLYGLEFSPNDLRFALVEAGEGKVGTLTDQVLLYCFRYDPHAGRYSLAILRIIRVAAGGAALLLFAGMFFAFRRDYARQAVLR